VVVVIALKVVGLAVNIGEASAGSVVPLQLGIHTLEAVCDQLRFVPGLSHTRKLPTSALHLHDHDLRLKYQALSTMTSATKIMLVIL
jgi:hypothetical protein